MTNTNTTNKVTKKDRYNELIELVKKNGGNKELIDFLEHEIELLDKKKSKSSEKVTSAQNIIQATIKDVLVELSTKVTIEILLDDCRLKTWIDEKGNEKPMTTQKLTSMLAKMIDNGIVTKEVDKRKTYYSLVNKEA